MKKTRLNLTVRRIWNDHRFEMGQGLFSADFNYDGFVDAADFNIWYDHKWLNSCMTRSKGDTDDDGDVDSVDFSTWVDQAF